MNLSNSGGRRGRLRRGVVALAMASALGVGLAACSPSSGSGSQSSHDSRTLIVGIAGDPATFDPGSASESTANEIIKNTYLQWDKYDVGEDSGKGYAYSNTQKILGEAASYTVSADGKTVSFTVANGAKFPSGDPVTSDDFIYTVDRALSLDTGPVFIFNTIGITSIDQVKKVDDTHFTFTLPQSSPLLGQLLRDQDASVLDSVAIKKHATSSDPWSTKWMATNSLGGGAYTVADYKQGSSITLTKNKDYGDAKDVYYNKVILQIIPSETDRAQLLKKGTIDIAEGLSPDTIKSLDGASGVKVLDIKSRSQNYMGLVEKTGTPFAKVEVREALSHAVNYKELANDVGKGYTQVPKGLWTQNSQDYDAAANSGITTTDLAKAKSLLADAGYSKGFSFQTIVSTSDTVGQAIAVALQTQFKKIGVTMTIKQLAAATFSETASKKSEDAFIVTGSSSYVDDAYYTTMLFYQSSGGLNRYDYDSPEMDALVKQLSTETDSTKRAELSSQVQKLLNSDVPVLSLGEPDYLIATRSDVSGFVLEPDSLVRYAYLKSTD